MSMQWCASVKDGGPTSDKQRMYYFAGKASNDVTLCQHMEVVKCWFNVDLTSQTPDQH